VKLVSLGLFIHDEISTMLNFLKPMKNIFFLVLILNSTNSVFGQSMPNHVISAGGENVVTTNNKIQFTIGESITLESSKTTLGFHSVFSKYLEVVYHHNLYNIQVYPNPIEDDLIVCITNLNSSLIIRNVNSETILSKTLTDYNNVIDFKDHNSGIYIIEITDGLNRKSYKFIKS